MKGRHYLIEIERKGTDIIGISKLQHDNIINPTLI